MSLKKKMVCCDFCKKPIEVEYDDSIGAREYSYLCKECGDRTYPNAEIEKEERIEVPKVNHYHIYLD